MRGTAEDKQRWRAALGRYMEDRRLELGLLWEQVAELTGLSAQGLRDVREKSGRPRPLTKQAIEKALQWEPGSIDLILAGGEPIPLSPAPLRRRQEPSPAATVSPDMATRIPNWFKSELERRDVQAPAILRALDVLRAIADHNQSTLAELLLEAGLAGLDELGVRDRPDLIRDAIENFRREVQRITASPHLSSSQKRETRAMAAEELLKILEKGAETT
ncbi:hypothetical protein AB0F17_08835 [Nonomuraea sp. NPDC026600]|uniref:hypothetical protein n=1 Tax=Nonomuraea sp. NPDC026600 TaxID=3155363 RepID=UPI0033FA7198